MAKTKAKWLNRNPADPQHVGAATLPYDNVFSISEKLQLLEAVGKPQIGAPDPAHLMMGEMVVWFDDENTPAIKVTYKDNSGVVRTGTMAGLA